MPPGLMAFAPHALARRMPNLVPKPQPLHREAYMEFQQVAALPSKLPNPGAGLSAFTSAAAAQSALLAQPSPPPETAYPEGDAYRDAGAYPEAVSAYLAAVEQHQGTPVAVYAEGEIGKIGALIAGGEATLADLDAIAPALPPWASLSAQGKYAVLSFYAVGSESALEMGAPQVFARMAPPALQAIEAFAQEHPADAFQVSTLGYYLELARALGPEALDSRVTWLRAIAEAGPAPMVRLCAHAMLADHEARQHRSKAGAVLHRASLLDELQRLDLEAIYGAGDVYYWVKGWLGYYLSTAHSELGQYTQAETALQRDIAYLPEGREIAL